MRAQRTPEAIAPSALFRAVRELERPQPSEGFTSLEIRPFEREQDPARTARAVIFWCDGVLRGIVTVDQIRRALRAPAPAAP